MNNILIVDDKSENLYLLELMLKGGGFTTVSARNGAEALALARQALPDLIISDILMPIMDGFTLCRELKKDRKLKNIPFIFYTATYTDPKDEEFALSLGADRFLLKPLDIPEFIAIVKTVLKEAKKKNIRKIEPSSSPEEVILKEYNQALVRKLEDKMVQIEHAEKEVRKYNIALLREIEERKQYAEALRESEIKYRAFFENSMDSILLTSPDGRIFSANPAACSMFGYSEEELIKFGRSAVVDTTDPQLSVLLTERTLTGKAHSELTFIRKDGTHFPAEISSSVFTDHEGLENTSMIIRDITEQKKAEQKIRESEKRFRAIFDQAPIAIALLDMQGYPIISNSPLSKLVGYSNDELSKLKFTDFTHTDDIDKDMNQFSDLIDGKIARYSMEKRYFHKNGNIVWANLFVTMLRDENGMPREIIGMAEDITERKQMELKLRESEERFRHSFDYAATGICIVGLDGKFQRINKVFKEMIGYEEDELKRFAFSDITYVDDLSIGLDEFEKMLGGEIDSTSFEKRYVRKDKQIIWVYVSTSLVRNVNHQPQFFITQIIDITERKHTEIELIEAKERAEQSNKMKDAFIANISHEIRTPLNGILGMTSIIREIYSPNMTSEEEGYFEAIRKSSDRIIRTIDLILNYSLLKTGTFVINPKQVELSSLCEEVTNHFITAAKSKALSLSFQNDLGKTFILADGYSIKQILFNLLENAIIYTQNGFVKMRLYKSKQDEILLDVRDSGIGIGSEYLSHIFESYRQEKMGYSRPYEGLGLGLAVVKQILSLHNAGINVKSKKGEGTTFTINFRKHTQNVEEKISIPNKFDKIETTVEKSDHLVLLVEDDELNQDITRKYIIRKYGCIATASYDGIMELLKKHKVDLIVMDIALKESLNGLEITKKLKASKDYKHIPVIAATAHASERDYKAAMEAGCADYLAKPFSMNQLLNKIDKFLQ